MATIQRRAFMKGATLGALAFTVGGSTIMLTAREARARNFPFRLLKEAEADIIEAIGDTLVQGARAAGVAHFIDHQISVPAEEALLQARIFNVRPPFVNFYRAAVGASDSASQRVLGYKSAEATPDQQTEFVHNMRQNKIDGWQGPPAPFVYTILRSDAVDVVYGTMEGYEMLGIPYQAHIVPEKRWSHGERKSRRRHRPRRRVRIGVRLRAGESRQEGRAPGSRARLATVRADQLGNVGPADSSRRRAVPARGQESVRLCRPGRLGRGRCSAALLRQSSALPRDRLPDEERAQSRARLADRLQGRRTLLRSQIGRAQ